MKTSYKALPILLSLPVLTLSQDVTVPTTCEAPYETGNDEVLYTVPYTYDQVLSIIGSYKNLTWSGNPDDTVTLNGSDNTVGTARTYDLAGAHVIETILAYDSPAGGPYYENHNVALLTVPRPDAAGGNVSVYFPLDATTVMSVCGGLATSFNFTAEVCSNNASAAVEIVHYLHMTDAVTVGQFLGGENFTSCEDLQGAAASSSPTSTGGMPVATFAGSANGLIGKGMGGMAVAVVGVVLMSLLC